MGKLDYNQTLKAITQTTTFDKSFNDTILKTEEQKLRFKQILKWAEEEDEKNGFAYSTSRFVSHRKKALAQVFTETTRGENLFQ